MLGKLFCSGAINSLSGLAPSMPPEKLVRLEIPEADKAGINSFANASASGRVGCTTSSALLITLPLLSCDENY